MNEIQVIEHSGQRVLTTEQLAQAYGCEPRRISENFNRNQNRFVEGKHFYKLEGDALRDFKASLGDTQIANNLKFAPTVYLWTHRGASRHCKMLGTDRAWEMFDRLEETYFSKKELPMLTPEEQMAQGLLAAQKILAEKNQQIKSLTADNLRQTQIIGELKPKADYTDRILQNKGLVAITAIAKDYGMSGTAMNKKLHELKIIYKMGNQWLLYSDYQSKGYTHSETIPITKSNGMPDIVMNTKWTQKGRLFLYDVLKKHNILPMIEQ